MTSKQIAEFIQAHKALFTTAQMVMYFRKYSNEDEIRRAMPYLTLGERLAFESILGKVVIHDDTQTEINENHDLLNCFE